MIQNLATAFGVAVLSMNAPTTTTTHEEPTRAYYDSSAVANYGTETQYIYNYSETTLYKNSSSSTLSEGESAQYNYSGSGYVIWYIYNQTPTADDYTNFYESHDLYIDGVLYEGADYLASGNGPSGLYINGTILSGGYAWLFDHEEASMTEGIFEVVGDTITEGAGVIGNGFASLVEIFWDGSSLTGMGILSLITLGVSVVWFSFAYVLGLIRKK